MITVALIVAGVFGYAAVGLLTSRLVFWHHYDGRESRLGDERFDSQLAGLFWPFTAIGTAGFCLWEAAGKVVTAPPRRVRLEARRAKLAVEIDRLERELEMK